jgi:hypothetical protein
MVSEQSEVQQVHDERTPVVQVLQRVRHDRHCLPSGRARPAQRLPGCGEVMNLGRRQRRLSRLQRPTLGRCSVGVATGGARASAVADCAAVCTEAGWLLIRFQRRSSSATAWHAGSLESLGRGAGGPAAHCASAVAAVLDFDAQRDKHFVDIGTGIYFVSSPFSIGVWCVVAAVGRSLVAASVWLGSRSSRSIRL